MDPERACWAAVINQAKDDVESLPMDSVDWLSARDFFLAGGDWSISRGAIAEMLDIHPSDIQRAGMKWVRQRCVTEGVPAPADEPPAPQARSAPLPRLQAKPRRVPLPRLEAIPDPDKDAAHAYGKLLHVFGGSARAAGVMGATPPAIAKRNAFNPFYRARRS